MAKFFFVLLLIVLVARFSAIEPVPTYYPQDYPNLRYRLPHPLCFEKKKPCLKNTLHIFNNPLLSPEQRIKIFSNYRFCVIKVKDSISIDQYEKIVKQTAIKVFDVFAARSVPVLCGPLNLEDVVPYFCIVYNKNLESNKKLYKKLYSIKKTKYNNYLKNIKKFLELQKVDETYVWDD